MALLEAPKLFREYIGDYSNIIHFDDVPINPNVEFHFIVAFAADYYPTADKVPHPNDGNFSPFWNTTNLSPGAIAGIKKRHPNVKVIVSIGGDFVNGSRVNFEPTTKESWIENAAKSLGDIIKEYKFDGIDINYQHFSANPDTFSRCIGGLITALKEKVQGLVVSIAPSTNALVQKHYLALWRDHAAQVDYVNFKFYTYPPDNTDAVAQFLTHFYTQSDKYNGGKVLASINSDATAGGLSPENGFFEACSILNSVKKFHGIFIWSADISYAKGSFDYEEEAQNFLAKI